MNWYELTRPDCFVCTSIQSNWGVAQWAPTKNQYVHVFTLCNLHIDLRIGSPLIIFDLDVIVTCGVASSVRNNSVVREISDSHILPFISGNQIIRISAAYLRAWCASAVCGE
jgi:hypothetical protein